MLLIYFKNIVVGIGFLKVFHFLIRKTEISRDEKLHLMNNNGSFEIRGELCGHFRSVDTILHPKVGILC